MSSTNFNNGKRHCFDRAVYSGVPHSSKKRVRHNKKVETYKKQHFKFNIESIFTMMLIAAGWTGGSEGMKILAMLFAFVSGWSYWKMED